jgi:branched-chain amino acid transport system substrate-binding protein
LASFALTQLGARKAAVLYDSESAYNRSLAESFRAKFTEGVSADESTLFTGVDGNPLYLGVSGEGLGQGALASINGDVVAFESYKTGDTDFTDQLTRIKEAGADVLFLPNYLTDVPAQVNQAKSLGITATIVGPDTLAQVDMLQACGAVCDGVYVTTDFRPEIPNKLAEKFIQNYAAAYGAAPEWPAASAYDSVKVLALALKRGAKVDREALRDGMTRVSYNGVSGNIRFAAGTGDPLKAANIMQIKDGQFVWIADVEP